jgi:hypothetical protein
MQRILLAVLVAISLSLATATVASADPGDPGFPPCPCRY